MSTKNLKKINRRSKSDITPEFKKLVQKIMDEHADALRELAKRQANLVKLGVKVKRIDKRVTKDLSPKFWKLVDKINKKNAEVFKELAKK